MFWHVSVCLSTGGVPISHNAVQHYPECHGADTWGGGGYPYPIMLCNITQNSMGQTPGGGGVPCQVQPGVGYPARGVPCWGVLCQGGTLLGVLCQGVPCWGVPFRGGTQVGYPPARLGQGVPCWGGYPVRTTEGVLTTRRAVCLLRSRRRTFLYQLVLLTLGLVHT